MKQEDRFKMLSEASVDETEYLVLSDGRRVYMPLALRELVRGYSEYAKEIVRDRAIPAIDGLKPVGRRALYTMYKAGVAELRGSGKLVGAVMEYHPHGDKGIYDSMTRMEETTGFMNVPLLVGKGFFGRVYSTSPAAHMRYTQLGIKPIVKELMQDMSGVRMISNYNDTKTEPETLPVPFPLILCNASSGIAVGVASLIPSYNFHEVNNAVIELIRTGTISTPLVADYPTGGEIVRDEKEWDVTMRKGRGRIKLRARWHFEGQSIVFTEIPYYANVDHIINRLRKNPLPGVKVAKDESDIKRGFRFVVYCYNKKDMNSVLMELLRTTDLQMSIKANVVVILDGVPKTVGLLELLRTWLEFRRNVIQTALQAKIEKQISRIQEYEYFVALIGNTGWRRTFTDVMAEEGKKAASAYLQEIFEGIPEDSVAYILARQITDMSGLAKKSAYLEELREQLNVLEGKMGTVDEDIIAELERLNAEYNYPRKTQVSEVEYTFNEEEGTVQKEATPVIVQVNGLFLKKMLVSRTGEEQEGIRCMSNDIISFMDDRGRLLRVAVENLDFHKSNGKERGTYLPVYLDTPTDTFKLMATQVVADVEVGYMYEDGFVSVVDYREWLNVRKITRISTKGVSPYSGKIVSSFDFTKTHFLLMTESRKFTFVSTNFKHKSRTARTRLVDVPQGDRITFCLPVNEDEMEALIGNYDEYMDKFRVVAMGDEFNGGVLKTLIQKSREEVNEDEA